MTLTLTFQQPLGVFVLTLTNAGAIVSVLETTDLAVIEKALHPQLVRMRHLAQGKTFAVKQPRSDA